MNLNELRENFYNIFDKTEKKEDLFFAPGRVNLIGEHTDYNGGNVFPCAITQGTYGIFRLRSDNKIRAYSENFSELGIFELDINDLKYKKEDGWSNYLKGLVKILKENNFEINKGFDVYYYGNIPNGAGLSSSASLEILTGIALDDLFLLNIDRIDLVKLCQKVENDYIGVNSGIMDQFAIGMGKQDKAILLDCNTLKYDYVPLVLENHSIIIANTNKKRGLAESKYNERRSECEEALKDLQTKLLINSLGELTEEEFDKNEILINSEVNKKRAKHAVYENQRTLKAVKALNDNNLKLFGELMNQSHISLRDDYEVTGFELDTLVESLWSEEGVVGARMTGAGFGGCTVSIVQNDKIDEIIKNVKEKYYEKTKLNPEFYIAKAGDGGKKLN